MPRKCVVPSCQNVQCRPAGTRVMFHRFPKERLRQWLQALQINPNTPYTDVKDVLICSEHFLREDYFERVERTTGKMRLFLKDTAVPSLDIRGRSGTPEAEPNQWTYRGENGIEHLVSVWAGGSSFNMVEQPRWPERSSLPAGGNSVTRGRFGRQEPLGEAEVELKRARLDEWLRAETGTWTNGETLPLSCDQPGSESCSSTDSAAVLSRVASPDQQGSAERCEESRAAELQPVGSLKVTIQQSSESREFRQTDGTDRQTGGLYVCYVCNSNCSSLQAFQKHMAGAEHQRRLEEITDSVCLSTHTTHGRGRQPGTQRWCDTCQSHFSGDVILHRRTSEHKLCKQSSRPFCSVCKRHFRTPRKFVEHMKSPEHKQQVQLEAQEEELITVDAVGCFQEEEEEDGEEEEGVEVVLVEDEEEAEGEEGEQGEQGVEVVLEEEEEEETEDVKEADEGMTDRQEYDPRTVYGSSFVVPVSGFLCRLCHKFFHREDTARHAHCRTHTHYLNLQDHRAKRRHTHNDTHTDTHTDKHTNTQ